MDKCMARNPESSLSPPKTPISESIKQQQQHTHQYNIIMMIPRRLPYPFYFLCWVLWPLILTAVCCWSLAPPKFSSKSAPPPHSRATTTIPRPTTTRSTTTTATTGRTPPLNFQQEDDSLSSSLLLLVERDQAPPVVVPRSSWIPRLAFVVVSQFHHRLFLPRKLPPSDQDVNNNKLAMDGNTISSADIVTTSTTWTKTPPSPFFYQHHEPPTTTTTTTTTTPTAAFNLDSFSNTVSLATATSITHRGSGILSTIPQDIPPLGLMMNPVDDVDRTRRTTTTFSEPFFPSHLAKNNKKEAIMWNLTNDLMEDPPRMEQEESPPPTTSSSSIRMEVGRDEEADRASGGAGASDPLTFAAVSVVVDDDASLHASTTEEEATFPDTIKAVPSALNEEHGTHHHQEQQQQQENENAAIRTRAAEIAHSFYAKEFRPAFFAKNPHLQTIVGTVARQESMYFPTTGNLILSKFHWDERQRVETPDGDFFDVDWKLATKPVEDASVLAQRGTYFLEPMSRTPLVLICHGLQSDTGSPLTKDMAISFNNVGMDVAAINFRGCSGEPNRTPMGYHLSYTADLELMVQRIAEQFPGRSIYLSGFSLGANVVTKFLADIGTKAVTDYNICGAAVNAVPFDLIKTQSINRPGLSGSVYGDRLVESLRNRVYASMDAGVKYNFTRDELANCTTCREFDDLVICSVYEDFKDADDYHRKSSTYDRLDQVMVPQFMLQALDDPFMEGSTNPENDPSLPCRIKYTKHGGHCGYVFHAEERDKVETSFMPRELARFVEHVHQVRTRQKTTQVALRSQPLGETSTTSKSAPTQESQRRRELAALASHSFETREFHPAPWARNEHVQTIIGTLFRQENKYVLKNSWTSLLKSLLAPKKEDFQWDERQRITTPDNDFFDVDWKFVDQNDSEKKPLVLICHGLQSDSRSPLVQDMASSFNNVGMDAACINFRGCSGEANKTPVGYHLGFTEDLKQMIAHVNEKYPGRRIYLSGFSLGANVVTACLAELGDQAYNYNVYGAAVNAVPFDMTKAHRNLNQNGLTKSIYGSRLLASMIDRVEESYNRIPFHFPKEEAAKCRTIMDMENLVIAPVYGFKDAYDYYDKMSTLHKVKDVVVPELVIQAKDDPFFVGQSMPPLNEPTRPLRIQQTEHGGHCGYVLHSVDDERATPETSWMPTELARFLAHIERTFAPKVL